MYPASGSGDLGLTFELASWWPKIYALRQAAPIGQAFVLMGIYLFLPFILLFSGYSIEVLFTVTVAVYRHQVPDPDLDTGGMDRQSHDGRPGTQVV